MPDREKVIEWLKEISLRPCDFTTEDFDADQTEHLADDALDLLREQEPVEPEIRTAKTSILFEGDCEISVAYCGCCGFVIEQQTEGGEGWKYCPCCGRMVKWDA